MIEVPQWRSEAEAVRIFCKTIKLVPQLDEYIVQFNANGVEYTSFVPERFMDLAKQGMGAWIIAAVDGGVLVDIPADTFTSGSRIKIRDSERDAVLIPFE